MTATDDVAESLLASARAEGATLALAPLAREVAADLCVAHPLHHIEVDASDDDPEVLADLGAQWQVRSNLLGNALKCSPPEALVELRVRCEARHAVVDVLDRGPGIPASDRARLFQPFGRLDSASASHPDGTGFGLYISRQLVERQGGRISVAARPGGGSVFSYTLPLAHPA